MEYKLTFEAIGELKTVNIYTTTKKPYGFVSIKTGYQGKTYLGASLFGEMVENVADHDIGRPVKVIGYIKNYKKKDGTYDKGFTAKEIIFLDDQQPNILDSTLDNENLKNIIENSTSIGESELPWYDD